MRIVMNTKTNRTWGTRRLFFDNLARDLEKTGIDVIQDHYDDYKNFDIAIVKNSDNEAKKIRNQNKSILIGMVHPSDYTKKSLQDAKYCDFIIAGSIEEADYYSFLTKNVFILPHIEDDWGIKKTNYNNNETLTIGYHGNKAHLEELYPRITEPLERISQKNNIQLKAIYNIEKCGFWEKNRPNIPIKDVQWNFDTLAKELCECDIGIIPQYDSAFFVKRKFIFNLLRFFNLKTGYTNDYLLRFKNTANAGRAFVFMQLGIPVICDMIPETCSVIDHGENGFLAMTSEAWYNSLNLLACNTNLRKNIGTNGMQSFKEKYSKDKYINDFCNFLKTLLKEATNNKSTAIA